MPASGPGAVRLFTSDAAILEAQDVRKDLPCTVTPVKPALGFDLKFQPDTKSRAAQGAGGLGKHAHHGVPRTPDDHPDEPVYFSQHISGALDRRMTRGGPAYLQGTFDVGEGKYHVDWLMRDRAERVCSFYWDVEASLPAKDKQMALDIAPGAMQPADTEPFKQEPPVERERARRAAQREGGGQFRAAGFARRPRCSRWIQRPDSILRNIAREPRISRFSIVAFNMQEQRVIYRQDRLPQIDFPALGKALKALNLGTVDLKQLSQKHGDTEFLANLITKELTEDKQPPDAVIFAGPKVMLEDGHSAGHPEAAFGRQNTGVLHELQPEPAGESLARRDRQRRQVPQRSRSIRSRRPRDLFFSWTEIMGRIVKSKFGQDAGGPQPRPSR